MDKEAFYEMLYQRAKEQGLDELAVYYDRKYSKAVGQREIKTLEKVLLIILLVVMVAPFIQFWLFR